MPAYKLIASHFQDKYQKMRKEAIDKAKSDKVRKMEDRAKGSNYS